MAREKPLDLDYAFNAEAANALAVQAGKIGPTQDLLEKLAAIIAASDTDRPQNLEGVVERKHVLKAAERIESLWGNILQDGVGYDVFLSYAHKEETCAKEFETKLKESGLTCFMASLTIKPGSAWEKEIWQAVRTSRFFLFLVSTAALKSKWCVSEIGAAIALQRPIVPHPSA